MHVQVYSFFYRERLRDGSVNIRNVMSSRLSKKRRGVSYIHVSRIILLKGYLLLEILRVKSSLEILKSNMEDKMNSRRRDSVHYVIDTINTLRYIIAIDVIDDAFVLVKMYRIIL